MSPPYFIGSTKSQDLKWQQCWEDSWTFRNTNNFTCRICKSINSAYKGEGCESKCVGEDVGEGEGVGEL